jgi:hydrogenase maturation protein HypF
VFVSQHIGDLDTLPAFDAFRRVIDSFRQLYDLRPELVACDLHPDYRSTQYAQALEFAAERGDEEGGYDFALRASGPAGSPLLFDWGPLVTALLDDLSRGASREDVASKFHNALVEGVAAVARGAGEERVVLTGGCFQNRVLVERTVQRFRAAGFRPYWHQRLPPNDGGVAVGQALAAQVYNGAATVRER